MKVVYITGCLGFIGSYVTRRCLEKGWMVYGVDKCTYAASIESLKEFEKCKNFTFEKIDIKDMTHLYDCDYIINLAAESHVGNSIVDSKKFLDSNVAGTQNLLELVRHKQENCNERPIFFHFSTDEVYGDIESGAHTEDDLLKPSNPYSAAKAAADMLVNAWARTYGVNYIILRPTNNYGIGQYPEKLIPLSVKNLVRNKKIRLHDGGEPVRTWLHADDTALAVIKIIESGNINKIYNVSGGFERDNLTIVNKILESFFKNKVTEQTYVDYIDFSYNREGQDVRYSLNDDALRSIGWSPQRKFDEEIENIVEYYKNNFIW
jgi:dTDP-glucose 4,6-dehydratase